MKPERQVEYNQSQDGFKGEEAKEAMHMWITEKSPRHPDKCRRADSEDNELNHRIQLERLIAYW